MKFDAPKDVLLKNIQIVQNVVGSKTSLPILSNILIDADENSIALTGTDLDVGIISTIPIKPAIKGSITVPAKKFMDIIKELPAATISISAKKNNMVWIECGKSQFKVIGLPKEEFPQLPEFKNKEFIPFQQKTLKKMLNLVDFSMSSDETRYVLNGVLFTIRPGGIRLVATDGRRLAMAEAEMQFPRTKETRAIVPAKTIAELGHILGDEGDVKIFFGENQVMFDLGQTKIISRLIEGDFPNYEQVIPKEAKDRVSADRLVLLAAVKRASLFSSQDSLAVKMELAKDKVILSKSTPYLGEVHEEIEADYKGKEIAIGFNPAYLIDVLKVLEGEKVNLEVVDPEKPGVVRSGKEYVYVVLPMQLTSEAREGAFGKLVAGELKKLVGKRRLTQEDLDEAWEHAAGKKASRHSRIAGLKKGQLTVNVDSSSWLYELTLEKRVVMEKLGGAIGNRQVKEVRFRIGELER